MYRKIMLLGSGELGKEFTIAAKRLGQYVIAVDSYPDAPAMQIADEAVIIDMLDGKALDRIVAEYKPDIIVPEVEAIRTENFYAYENQGIQVVPSARAANFTMNRKAIRDLASKELGLKTAPYEYATSADTLREAVGRIGMPCVVKPLMSSSGKGQSVIKTAADIDKAWEIAVTKGRSHDTEVIVEGFINFHSEITLLTVTQKKGPTLFCPPIGHRQERGDYMESWQPEFADLGQLEEARHMAREVTEALTGYGIWGVEFFLAKEGVYFSELSPRPHDTGMVTLARTLNFSEFELHLRAVLGLTIPEIVMERAGASAVILAHDQSESKPVYKGFEEAASIPGTDFRIFGKPVTRPYRRMGVALAYGDPYSDVKVLRERARQLADCISINGLPK